MFNGPWRYNVSMVHGQVRGINGPRAHAGL